LWVKPQNTCWETASDLKQLEKRLAKHEAKATAALKQLQSQKFACQPDALTAAALFSQQLPYPQLQDLQAIEIVEHKKRGRPRKDAVGEKLDRAIAPAECGLEDCGF
jgi:transposase